MPAFEGKKALIIEDDHISIAVLQRLLERLSVEASVLLHSLNILSELEALPRSDVIFLDLDMPVFNGYTVLRKLKAIPTFKDVPVVAYTTHISHMNTAKSAGFHSFLGKPLDSTRFPDQLLRILKNEPVWEVS